MVFLSVSRMIRIIVSSKRKMYESCRKHNFSYIVFYIYIYIYIQVFSDFFLQNRRIAQRNAPFQEKTTEIIVYFRENEQKQIISLRSRGYSMRFDLYLRKSACAATITGNLHMISWRNRPRIPATDAKISPLPAIYPRHPVMLHGLPHGGLFLIFLKNFGIIYIENKGNIKHFPDFHNNNIRFIRRKKE